MLVAVVVATVLAPGRGTAQATLGAAATLTSVEYEGYLRSLAVTLSPTVRMARERVRATASASITRFESGSHSWSIEGAGARIVSSGRASDFRLRGDAGVSGYAFADPAGWLSLGGHLSRDWATAGLWASGDAGTTTGPVGNGVLTRAEAGSWIRSGTLTARSMIQPSQVRGVRYTDVLGDVSLGIGVVRLSAVGGRRIAGAAQGLLSAPAWAYGTVGIGATRSISLLGSFGRAPYDPVRGAPSARWASVGVQVMQAGAARRIALAASGALTRFAGLEPADGGYRLRIVAPRAQMVEIMGDFTRWEPIVLERRGMSEEWEARIDAARGVHYFNVRIDSGAWTVPAGIGVAEDDLAGRVAILVIGDGRDTR